MRLRGIGTPAPGWALWLGLALAASPGCETPAPPVPAPEPPAVPSEPQEPAEPPEEPYPVVSQCENSTIRVGAPRRIDEPDLNQCTEEYEVDFVVEAGPSDTMLLDMFQSHMLWNWRVSEAGETVRHEFSLRLAPYWHIWAREGRFPGIRPHEPIVVQRCPEGTGEGPVLACTTVRCGLYDDVSEVPPLTPEHLQLALTVPEHFLQQSIIREGETVAIPVTFQSFRRLTHDLTIGFDLEMWDGILPYVDLEIEPREIVLPAGRWSRTNTVEVLRLTLKRYDYEALFVAEPSQALAGWDFDLKVTHRSSKLTGPPCATLLPSTFRFRVPGPNQTELSQSAR